MKALAVKDFYYYKTQYRMLIIVAILSVMYLFSDLVSFGSFFLPFLVSIFMSQTIAQDCMSRHAKTVFTLPFTRTAYVIEKYGMCILPSCIFGVLYAMLAAALGKIAFTEAWTSMCIALLVIVLYACINIPLNIYFKERGSVYFMVVCVVLFFVTYLITSRFPQLNETIMRMLSSADTWSLYGMGIFAIVLALGISMPISVALLNKAEF